MSMTKEEVDEVMEIFNTLWRHPAAGPRAGCLHGDARVWYYQKLRELGLLEDPS